MMGASCFEGGGLLVLRDTLKVIVQEAGKGGGGGRILGKMKTC